MDRGVGLTESILDDLERQLSETRQILRTMRAGTTPAVDEVEPARGVGEDADGMVRVEVEAGKVTRVTLDPRAMRRPSEDLAEAFTAAVNAAFANLATTPAQATPLQDPAALEARLVELQDQSVRQMSRYMQGISEVLARLGS